MKRGFYHVRHVADEKTPSESHLYVTTVKPWETEADEEIRSEQNIWVAKSVRRKQVSPTSILQEALVGSQETQCTSVRQPGGFQDYRTALQKMHIDLELRNKEMSGQGTLKMNVSWACTHARHYKLDQRRNTRQSVLGKYGMLSSGASSKLCVSLW